jgi:hypothetical protein
MDGFRPYLMDYLFLSSPSLINISSADYGSSISNLTKTFQ